MTVILVLSLHKMERSYDQMMTWKLVNMYSSDTDAQNYVNSHVLRRITYMTCQTSHTYNTLPVLFSILRPSSRVVAQISSLLATLLYENQQYIKGIIVFMSKKVYAHI